MQGILQPPRSGKAMAIRNILGLMALAEEQQQAPRGVRHKDFRSPTKRIKKESKVRRKIAARSRAINRQRGVGK